VQRLFDRAGITSSEINLFSKRYGETHETALYAVRNILTTLTGGPRAIAQRKGSNVAVQVRQERSAVAIFSGGNFPLRYDKSS
jgi:hypothetical protein